MRKSRFSEEQKVKMLREAEQSSVAAVAKKHGISAETLYKWKRKYGGMEVAETKRLKQLEQENAQALVIASRGSFSGAGEPSEGASKRSP